MVDKFCGGVGAERVYEIEIGRRKDGYENRAASSHG